MSEGKCPFHAGGGGAETLPEGAEMCSHARKKLEAKKMEEAEAAPTGKCPYAAGAPASKPTEGKCPVTGADASKPDGIHIPDGEAKTWSSDELKTHFTSAYNNVAASSAPSRGDAEIASILVEILGYTKEEIDVIGKDVCLMQGTGNPHTLAALKDGETVVDLGSGFGIDAVLAASKVGASGRVIGVDLSINEITSALKRVNTRRLRNVDFRLGDIECPPIDDGSVDAVISNGGFCLVPNKPVAFAEIFRILKPGGRFSISCTVRRKDLDMSLNWPSCMVVFMPLPGAKEMLEGIGFREIVVDDSNSAMDVWDEKVAPEESKEAKLTIHRGDPQYDFLKAMDMNEYFARVNIFGRKPAE